LKVEIRNGGAPGTGHGRPFRAAEFVTEGWRFATLKESLTKSKGSGCPGQKLTGMDRIKKGKSKK
jgi:hypothetical protein